MCGSSVVAVTVGFGGGSAGSVGSISGGDSVGVSDGTSVGVEIGGACVALFSAVGLVPVVTVAVHVGVAAASDFTVAVSVG